MFLIVPIREEVTFIRRPKTNIILVVPIREEVTFIERPKARSRATTLLVYPRIS